jgi:predicted DNA-binding transcriptional regulator AlpA
MKQILTESVRAAAEIEPLLEVKEVMVITRLSRNMVYRLIKTGILPGTRLPGCDRIMVSPADLRAYLARGRAQAQAK